MFLNKYCVLVFVFSTSLLYGQEEVQKDTIKSEKLDEVVVTATRTVRQLSSLPMPVTLVSQKQIKQAGSVRLSDILIEQTGITSATDVGNFRGVQIQGLDAEYTLILLDGVPLIGRRAGNIDLDRVTVNNIKQIEIVKGPSSSLYGSEALGGVINIITEKPKNDVFKGDFQLLTRGGARNELDINTSTLYRKDKFGMSAGINLNSSSGFDLTPQTEFKTSYPHQNFTGNLRLTYDFSDKVKFLLSNRYFTEEQNSTTSDNSQKDWNINAEIAHKISDKWKFDYTFYATKFKTESTGSFFNQTLLRPEVRSQFAFGKIETFIGVGANIEKVDRTAFLRPEKFSSQYAFVQADFNPLEKLNIVLGARFDNHSEYKSAFSPKLSARYTINDWLTTRASLGYGFKAPDFRQLYFNFRNTSSGYVVFGVRTLHELHGNLSEVQALSKDLNPENSVGYNVGLELKPTLNLKISINAFRNDIKDLINSYDTELNSTVNATNFANEFGFPNTIRIFSYENRSRVYTQGVEVDVNYRINDNFNFSSGYQFLQAKDKDEEVVIKSGGIFFRRTPISPSERMTTSNYFGLANRSKHMANAKLYYQNFEHRFSANLRAIYRSKYALFDTNNSQGIIDEFDQFINGNVQLNFAVSKKIFSLLDIQLGIDNLLKEEGTANLNKHVSFANNDSVLLLGRTYYGRVTFKF